MVLVSIDDGYLDPLSDYRLQKYVFKSILPFAYISWNLSIKNLTSSTFGYSEINDSLP